MKICSEERLELGQGGEPDAARDGGIIRTRASGDGRKVREGGSVALIEAIDLPSRLLALKRE